MKVNLAPQLGRKLRKLSAQPLFDSCRACLFFFQKFRKREIDDQLRVGNPKPVNKLPSRGPVPRCSVALELQQD
jgi:hypothetical protein